MSYSQSIALSSSVPVNPFLINRNAYRGYTFTQLKPNIISIGYLNPELKLRREISVQYKEDGEYFLADFSAGGLVIASAKTSIREMINDIKYQLADAWEYYVKEDDDNLTLGAKRVKEWLSENIYEV